MKTSLDKCKLIYSDKCDSTHRYIQLWVFLRYCNAEKHSWSLFELFSRSINSVFSGSKREVEYKELFGKELRAKQQALHYIIMH